MPIGAYDGDDIVVKGAIDKDTPGTSNVITYTEDGDRRRLNVDAKIIGNIPVTSAVMCYSSKKTFDLDDTDVALTGTLTDQYSYSGTGKLIGFMMGFDKKDSEVQLLVDSDEVFKIEAGYLDKFNPVSGGMNAPDMLGIYFEPNNKTIIYYPRYPICFETDVKIRARTTSGNVTRIQYIVSIEKIT